MIINSINFWIFFACVVVAYYGIFRKSSHWQNITLLLASYIFYGMVDWEMCVLLLGATGVFYYIGLAIDKYNKENPAISSTFTTVGVCLGVGLLLYFKYLNFFMDQFSMVLGCLGLNTNWNTFNIIMPLGISFFTFKLIAYVIEVHRGNMHSSKNPIAFGTYIAFFPTIMSGPIDNPTKFLPQLERARTVDYDTIGEAGKRILWGMFLKMCIADQLSGYTSAVLGNYEHHNATSILLASFLYSIQIYTDFAGYSEMAIGTSRLLGISVMENFKRPYLARSVTDFWKRWHISLTKWLTYYVYITLGGNRCSKLKQYWNIMMTFLVSGFWHGANWTFVVWGILHGIYQVIEKVLGLNNYLKQPSTGAKLGGAKFGLIRALFTFVLVTVNWLLFQASSLEDFYMTLLSLGNGFGPVFSGRIGQFHIYYPAFLAIALMFLKELKDEHQINMNFLHSNIYWVRVFSVSALIIYIMLFGALNGASFIYFQF